MVDIYPVRYVENYPGVPLQVQVVNTLQGYPNGYTTITTVPPGATIYIATVTANQVVNLVWGILGSAPTQTLYLNVLNNGATYSLILNEGVLSGYFYEQSIIFPANSTIGLSFSNSGTITVAYGGIF